MAAKVSEPETDAELMVAAVTRSEVFGAIFDRHAESVLRFFVRRVGPDEAGGLLSEVFRIAFERRSSYATDQPDALPWLYGIASNQVRTHRRSQARRLRASLRIAMSVEHLRTEETGMLEARLILPQLAEAIDTLPDAERETLLLFALEDLGYGDIAAALEIPIGTVRSRINRARKRLRALLPAEASNER